MRIALTVDPEIPVPPVHYGGIERIVDMLARGLAERGHEVTLFAHSDSTCPVRRVAWKGRSSGRLRDTLRNAATLARRVALDQYDVVNSFSRLAYLVPILPLPVPKLMSYHREISVRTTGLAHRLARGTLEFSSIAQHLMARRPLSGSWHHMPNGLVLSAYDYCAAVPADAPLAFLGRIEEIKGAHLAIEVARRTGRKLILAGNVPPGHRPWFESHIAPHVDGERIRYTGPVDDAQKSALLGGACALLMPVLWEEPFGLVMIEAMACGTPVIGFRRGGVPEVVADGETGYDLERRLLRPIEARYLPGCAYVTAASPGIAEAYTEAYDIERPRVVLNTFPLGHAAPAPTPRGTAQPGPSLYWFSQTIGPDRGIECAVRAIGIARSEPHLYLRGTPAPGYASRLTDLAREVGAAERVHLLPPDEPDRMEQLAAAYDAGLCSETGHTASRRLCLTNKLFSFLLAGIPPLLSDTPAHCRFAAEAGLTGLVYPRDDSAALARLLDGLLGDSARLSAARAQAWRLGQVRYNWERERGLLLEAVGRVSRAPTETRPTKLGGLDRLRQMRDRSRVLKVVHSALRGPYYGVLCFLYRRGVRVELPGRHGVRVHPRLLGIRPTEYEVEFSAALDCRVSTGMTVVDVGAHVGLHSLRLSRAVGDAGHVIAVEASPANASLLRKHLEWNRCRNVTVIEAVAGECESEIEFAFRQDPTDPGGFANSVAYDIGGNSARVKVTTIDEVCRGLTPDVIKIDIEGAELLAVRGARRVLSESSPILFVAVHPDAMRALGTSPSELVELLGKLGYVGRHLDGSMATNPGLEEIVFEKGRTGTPLRQ